MKIRLFIQILVGGHKDTHVAPQANVSLRRTLTWKQTRPSVSQIRLKGSGRRSYMDTTSSTWSICTYQGSWIFKLVVFH